MNSSNTVDNEAFVSHIELRLLFKKALIFIFIIIIMKHFHNYSSQPQLLAA